MSSEEASAQWAHLMIGFLESHLSFSNDNILVTPLTENRRKLAKLDLFVGHQMRK